MKSQKDFAEALRLMTADVMQYLNLGGTQTCLKSRQFSDLLRQPGCDKLEPIKEESKK